MSQAIASSAPLHETSDTERACALLCTDFANALDAQAYSSVLQLFTDDAEIVSEGRAVRGHDAIQESLSARPAEMITRHICSNIRIEQRTADSATGICYVTCYKFRGGTIAGESIGTPAPIIGEYHDKYVRTVAGWRIQERRIVVVFNPPDTIQ